VSEPGKPVGAEDQQVQKAGPLQVFRAVLWSFIGIRKSSGYADDVAKIKPVQVIVAGVIVAAVFVASLVVLVKFLTAK
jgi:hypothetical protein